MKILYFIEEAKLGGPQVQMVRLAAALADLADIEIMMPEENSEAFRQLCDDNAVTYRIFPISRLTKEPGPLATFVLRSPLEIVRLVRVIRRIRPDLIHAWGGSWQIKASIVSRLTGVPLVWLMNDTKVPGVVLAMFRRFASLCQDFIFASHRSSDYYHSHIPAGAHTAVIQSMVDLDSFDPTVDWPGDEDFVASLGDATVIGMIANINSVKGIETFIRVAARARASGRDTRFVVIGSVFTTQQAYFDGLKATCHDLGATNVIFAGGRRDVRPVLKRFDIYLCTSVAESSPVSVWEAMAMGCAVVSTDVGDVPRFVKHGETGFIASVGDDLALWQAIEILCTNRDLANRMGSAARAVAKAAFGRPAIADQTMAFYRVATGLDAEIAAQTKERRGTPSTIGAHTT